MSFLLPSRARDVAATLVAFAVVGCASAERPIAPGAPRSNDVAPQTVSTGLVISQVYGGGGNAGATLRRDFIELYNPTNAAISVAGWSVQYASATGSSWQVTTLNGSVPARGYYLIAQAQGTGGTQDLPTPDVTGSIPMSGTAGKVALVSGTAALSGTCPTTNVVDFVGFGSTANCFEGTGPTPAPSNTLAVIRINNVDTGNNAADFQAATPNPRNSGGQSATPLTIAATSSTILVGGTTTLTATLTLNGSPVTPTSVTWSAAPTGNLSFDPTTGATTTATGTAAGATTVTATAVFNATTYTATRVITVNPAPSSLFLEGYSFRGTDPLPAGFQELYRVKTEQSSNTFIRNRFRWTTSDASVATVDSLGNVTGVWSGATNRSVTISAEDTTSGSPTRGRIGTTTLSVRGFAWSDTVGVYANPLQFGAPTGAALGGNVLVQRATFASSWSDALGQPSWVAYNLDASHRQGSIDRCDCFTPDPLLPSTAKQVTSADYDGTGYSRGHMTMSADRTRGELDNATTFYFSNIIPQTNANNGGPWLGLEQALGDSARNANKELYIFAGGARYNGWLNSTNPPLGGQQRVAIPGWTWKVALLMERSKGAADLRTAADARLIAVSMPNTTTIPQTTASWPNYRASVDSVEKLTGLTFFGGLSSELANVFRTVPAGVQPVSMDVQPARVSLTTTSVVNVIVYSGAFFDASAVNAADLRLVVAGQQVAPASRGGVVTSSVRDFNGDGRADRLVGFTVAALRTAGLTAGTADLSLRLAGNGTPAWLALDGAPATIVP